LVEEFGDVFFFVRKRVSSVDRYIHVTVSGGKWRIYVCSIRAVLIMTNYEANEKTEKIAFAIVL